MSLFPKTTTFPAPMSLMCRKKTKPSFMKTRILSFLATMLAGGILLAQSPVEIANASNLSLQNPSQIRADFGMLFIDGQAHIGMRVQPELSIAKFGFGLNIPVFYSLTEQKIRTEEYQGGVGLLRLIDYLRYGRKKKDPLFIRAGRLDAAYLGFGILLNNYSNSISFEKRVIGLEFDVLFDERFGLEGMYSNLDFTSFNLLALRPYYKPFGKTFIPILKTMEIGLGFVADFDQTSSTQTNDSLTSSNSYLQSGMMGLSADMGLFLLNTRFIDITSYAQYGRLFKNEGLEEALIPINMMAGNTPILYDDGQGASVGLAARIRFLLNIFELTARIERQWYSAHFIPHFFDYTYEIDKNAKIERLASAPETRGIYGSLTFDVVNKIFVSGGVLMPDAVSEEQPATAFLNLNVPDLIPKTYLNGRIIKSNVTSLSSVIELDEYTQANLIAAYKILPFFHVGVDYRWTFIPAANNTLSIDYQVMPYVGLNIPLNEW